VRNDRPGTNSPHAQKPRKTKDALTKTRLHIPVLSIGGDKSLGIALGAQARLIASDVTIVIVRNAGHWLME